MMLAFPSGSVAPRSACPVGRPSSPGPPSSSCSRRSRGCPRRPGRSPTSTPTSSSTPCLPRCIVRALVAARVRGVTARVAVAARLLAALYGVTDELHQRFVPGRRDVDDLRRSVRCRAMRLGARARRPALLRAWAIIRRRRMTYENLLIERDEAVATITFNRPAVLNALNQAHAGRSSDAAFDALGADAACARSCSPARARRRSSPAPTSTSWRGRRRSADASWRCAGRRSSRASSTLGKPVDRRRSTGSALGGGCELALACTFRFAADTAQIGQPEINLGHHARLRRVAAPAAARSARTRAMELILTGRRVGADEALAHRAGQRASCRPRRCWTRRGRFARELAAKAPIAAALRDAGDQRRPRDAARAGPGVRGDAVRPGRGHRGHAEGTRAFLEKRKPCGSRGRSTTRPRIARPTDDQDSPENSKLPDAQRPALRARRVALQRRVTDAAARRRARGADRGRRGADAIETFEVPGAFEIPFAAQAAAATGRFDAVVCLGCLIRGDTPHFEYIAVGRRARHHGRARPRPACRWPSAC